MVLLASVAPSTDLNLSANMAQIFVPVDITIACGISSIQASVVNQSLNYNLSSSMTIARPTYEVLPKICAPMATVSIELLPDVRPAGFTFDGTSLNVSIVDETQVGTSFEFEWVAQVVTPFTTTTTAPVRVVDK